MLENNPKVLWKDRCWGYAGFWLRILLFLFLLFSKSKDRTEEFEVFVINTTTEINFIPMLLKE